MTSLDNMNAHEAATITMRLPEQAALNLLGELLGYPMLDDWPEADIDVVGEYSVDMASVEFALVRLLIGDSAFASAPISGMFFYRHTLVGPALVLFEDGTGMVQMITRRPSEGIYRTVRWMFEGGIEAEAA